VSQVLPNSAAVIVDGDVKKSHVATAAAHVWSNNVVIKELQVNSINIISLEAELMAIHTRLIPAMEIDDIHDITVIIDSITAERKILESKVDPLQNMFIPLASAIKSFFSKDSRNKIHFWYCSSKAEWPRHKLIDDQVKANAYVPTFPSKDLHLFSKKKKCNNILCKLQTLFANSLKKGYYFLNFEDKKQRVIKPTYAKGSSWLPVIGFTNSLYACFTHMTTEHAPIREYRQRFFPHLPTSCPCGEAEVQTHGYIIIECNRHNPST